MVDRVRGRDQAALNRQITAENRAHKQNEREQARTTLQKNAKKAEGDALAAKQQAAAMEAEQRRNDALERSRSQPAAPSPSPLKKAGEKNPKTSPKPKTKMPAQQARQVEIIEPRGRRKSLAIMVYLTAGASAWGAAGRGFELARLGPPAESSAGQEIANAATSSAINGLTIASTTIVAQAALDNVLVKPCSTFTTTIGIMPALTIMGLEGPLSTRFVSVAGAITASSLLSQ